MRATRLRERLRRGEPSVGTHLAIQGVRHFCIGWDVAIPSQWFETSGAAMRAILAGAPARAEDAGGAGGGRSAPGTLYPRHQ